MLRECCICGKEYEEKYMERRSPSPSHPQWMCYHCYVTCQKEATLYDIKQGNKLRKMSESRKKK
jgi:hypothetical protein